MRFVLFAVVLMMAGHGQVFAQAPDTPATGQPALARPRQTATAIAGRIRDIYFDPVAADRIADALEAAAAAGEFDALTDGRDLAPALSAFLRPADAHFSVMYDPGPKQPPRSSDDATPPPGRPRGDPNARAHYGFRRVEILPGNVGYIELRQFYDIDFNDHDDGARRAADSALTFVADADAVIIDLRDNGGGAPSMVGYLISAFTPVDAQIYNAFHSRSGVTSEAPRIHHPRPRLDVPTFVLISARSASAAESFPYTLQAAGRATIVGEVSAGAANPGGTFPVEGGFRIFISDGSPRNPITGANWEGTGVQPDVPAPWNAALNRAHALALAGIVAADVERRDAAWALEAIQSTASAGDLTAYVGTYGDVRVRVENGSLVVARGRRPPATLAPLGNDLFTTVGEPSRRIGFVRDDAGRVTAMEGHGVSGPPSRIRRNAE